MRSIACLLLLALAALAPAADLAAVPRTIAKQPAYAGKPQYCLLVFGAEAKHRVWIVHDGAVLYVDRNGNGDLTEAGEKVAANKGVPGADEPSADFDVGDLKVGGKTHKGLNVLVSPIKMLADNASLMELPHVGAAIRKNPEAFTGRVILDVECESLQGAGIGGRVSYMINLFDTEGLLQFGNKPADAPIIQLDGPLVITLYGSKPTWQGGQTADTILCVGSRGRGPGTFAMVKYDGVVPEGKHPKVEAVFQPKDPAAKPIKELFELKERC